MGSVTRPRGRLPRRVYWVRRSLALALAVLLVLGIGKLVGGLGSDSPDTATTAASTTSGHGAAPTPSAAATSAAPVGPVAPAVHAPRRQAGAPLATPSGPCRVEDVSVLPEVPQAPGGGDIPILLQLAGTEPACTFTVSAKTIAVKITRDDTTFWTSQQCPAAIPDTQVVVRSGTPATVPVTWNGRASDDECSHRTEWAGAGSYRVYAAAIGSSPSDVDFDVTTPERPVKTETVKPRPSRTTDAQTASPSASADTASPTR